MLNKRKPETHKGDYGHLLVAGASPGLTGAVCLAARAALRSGAGLVTVAVPEPLNPIIEVKLTESMSLPLPANTAGTLTREAADRARTFMDEKTDGIVVGPGISVHPDAAAFVRTLLPEITVPTVIDADAVKILGSSPQLVRDHDGPLLLTPHPGEMSALTGKSTAEIQKARVQTAVAYAAENGVILVLKGNRTVVTDGKTVYVNPTGNPGMATAGSGDVLSGILGGLLVQGIPAFVAAKIAVYAHGLAGDLAAGETGETSLIASDIIRYLPDVFRRIRD